ncbi:diphthine--ammonia ligase-like [Elysia marginata]|uniref:Diphthine--ammonia ligase n=1 Tax=Elysia marginata TaxID=1093978 RepID=A0AAV4EAQ0_9GAST|nr:diphthine--ammonia ligase-like [Elysia marginata]
MKTVALISGGKDSCFNMMCCVAEGHEIVALANLRPEKDENEELDSYMFQTVGHTAIDLYAEAMGLPLYVQTITGTSLATDKDYRPQDGDEVEDLYKLLQAVKDDMVIEAVSVGAILSDYQRVRVENVCGRLGLVVLSFLWRRDQEELLQEMISCGVKAKIIKVAAMGLTPQKHLGLELSEIFPHMLDMKSKYGLNVCGEGGEYETFVFDCPLFQQRISIDQTEEVIHSDDAFAPVGYLKLKSCSLLPKLAPKVDKSQQEQMRSLPLLNSDKYIEKLNFNQPPPEQQANVGDSEVPSPTKAGGGDSELPRVFMCVPDVQLDGSEPPVFKSNDNTFQVSGVRAIVGKDVDLKAATLSAMNNLKDCLISHSLSMEDIVSFSLYVGDMSKYADINSVYSSFYEINPPVRVCVEANLPRNVALQLDCQGCIKTGAEAEGGQRSHDDEKVLHVQAMSHWAPANIGPYSQARMIDGKLYMAGIVPLVPATLQPVEGGITIQSRLALTHVQSVMSAIAPTCQLNCCPIVTCYITRPEYIEVCHQQWDWALKELRSSAANDQFSNKASGVSPCLQCVQVSALPKASLVEWHVFAWPNLQDNEIHEVRQAKHCENHSIQATAQHCSENPSLFSCHITLDVTNFEGLKRTEKICLPNQMVNLFCQVWRQCFPSQKDSNAGAMPLVKIFFCPTIYDYSLLHKYFTKAVSETCSSHAVPEPVISLIPVSGLESRKQILAWCQ